jgi:hypothetical protein
MLKKDKLNNINVLIVIDFYLIDLYMELVIMEIVNMKKQEEINVINVENYAML